MLRNGFKQAVSILVVALVLGAVAPTTSQADDPGISFSFPDLGVSSTSGAVDWSNFAAAATAQAMAAKAAVSSVRTPAAAPQAPVESPEVAVAPTAPTADSATAVTRLPATGTGAHGFDLSVLSVLALVAGGVSCLFAARRFRA